jgi:hypothetical protein
MKAEEFLEAVMGAIAAREQRDATADGLRSRTGDWPPAPPHQVRRERSDAIQAQADYDAALGRMSQAFAAWVADVMPEARDG